MAKGTSMPATSIKRTSVDEAPYKRGYNAPSDMRSLIAGAHQTRLGFTIFLAFGDCMSITVSALAVGWIFTTAPLALALCAAVVLCVFIGRQLRGLECLVHEASHFNWSRKHRRANDLLAFLLAGAPTGARIADYRASHLLHHGRFGTGSDPDLARYRQLGLEELPRQRFVIFAASVMARLPKYQVGWLAAITSTPTSLLAVITWFGIWIIAPAAALLSTTDIILTTGSWLICYTFVLPVIRFVGEAGEHIYSSTDTVFDATISNIGIWHRLLIHPHNDGYHTVHHLWPGVPHHQIRRLHRLLTVNDPDNYGKKLRYRTRVLQSPITGL